MWETAPAHTHSKRRILWILAIITVTCILAATGLWFYRQKSTSPFPSRIQKTTQLSLLYPGKLPKGYTVDPNSMSQTGEVITYVATKPGKSPINFSIQPRAEKFDYSTFYSSTLLKSFKFTTNYGEATVGSMQSTGNTVGSFINGETWVIVSAPASIKAAEVQAIINDFQIYSPQR